MLSEAWRQPNRSAAAKSLGVTRRGYTKPDAVDFNRDPTVENEWFYVTDKTSEKSIAHHEGVGAPSFGRAVGKAAVRSKSGGPRHSPL